jgi:flagellar motor switch protein FliG
MFSFADFPTLSDLDTQEFLREVNQNQLAVGLKDAPEALSAKIFANMSTYARVVFQKDVREGTPESAEIDSARKHMVKVALDLAKQGRIKLA